MTDVKLTKSQIKSPDQIQKSLTQGFKWTTQHSKGVLLAVAAFVLLGGGISAKTYLSEKAENEIQTEYFKIEKTFLEKKSDYLAAAQPAPFVAKGEKVPPAPAKATGDLAKDYGTVPQDFMAVIDKAPKSKAAQMAALNLSDLQVEYKQVEEAKATLGKVKADGGDLLGAMVLVQLGTLQADQKDCPAAVSTWQKVISNSSAKALHSAARLKTGLCYESMNDTAQAEKMYAQIKAEDKDSTSAKSAEKYLRLLQAKK